MLSICVMAAGQARYYTELAREDYYLEGGEPRGVWLGQGATSLGLEGTVQKEALRNLFLGDRPDGSGRLVQAQSYGARQRRAGFDLTFSAPKSISTLWALSDETVRQQIQAAHFAAVQAAIGYLEQSAGFTRRGSGGERLERAQFIVAAFEHGTSRAQDPQLHTHALLLNIARAQDGSFGALRHPDLFAHKMATGAIYRTELAQQLRVTLGLSFLPLRNWFEVAGVPKRLIEAFSSRRAEILAQLAERGASGPAAAEAAALVTRERKEHVARADLFSVWQSVGEGHGFGLEQVQSLLGREEPVPKESLERVLGDGLERVLGEITHSEAYFQERDLVRKLAEWAATRGVGAAEILSAVDEGLRSPDLIRRLGDAGAYGIYTTPEMYSMEQELLEAARGLRSMPDHMIARSVVDEALRYTPTIRADQEGAVRSLTENAGAIQCVEGVAGSGKTFMLGAARRAWENAGYHVVGVTLSGKAARELEKGSGIATFTTRQFGHRADLAEGARGALGLDSKTAVVVDEAGMIATKGLLELVRRVSEAGAKLILVGDRRQLQPIEAGGPFAALCDEFGFAELREVTRQHEDWMQEATRQLADGDVAGALAQYALADRVHVADTRGAAQGRLIWEWVESHQRDSRETAIFAGTRRDVRELNDLAQRALLAHGELDVDQFISLNRARIHCGDRVVVCETNRRLGVDNGERATIEAIEGDINHPTRVVVRLDRTRGGGEHVRVTMSLEEADELLELGYATTVHKGQGATVDRSFVLAGGPMQDAHLSYVQMTRHREDCRIFTSRDEAGEDLAELVRVMERERLKQLALQREAELTREQAGLAAGMTPFREPGQGLAGGA